MTEICYTMRTDMFAHVIELHKKYLGCADVSEEPLQAQVKLLFKIFVADLESKLLDTKLKKDGPVSYERKSAGCVSYVRKYCIRKKYRRGSDETELEIRIDFNNYYSYPRVAVGRDGSCNYFYFQDNMWKHALISAVQWCTDHAT